MIKLNEKILLVMNCVYHYKMYQSQLNQLSGIENDWYKKTFEFYKSLALPSELKKTVADFETILAFDPDKEPYLTWNRMESDKLSKIIFKY